MKIIGLIIFIFFLNGCGKPKAQLICGDHVCVNKTEAKQFFEENLTIEVKIIDKKVKEKVDLVELNLKENQDGRKMVKIFSKKKTDETIKKLSKDERKKIIKNINLKKKNKKIVRRTIQSNKNYLKNDVNKRKELMTDVCSVIKKCNIIEISNYLIKEGKNKNFPNINIRQ